VYKHRGERKNHIAAAAAATAVMNESIDWLDTDDNFLF